MLFLTLNTFSATGGIEKVCRIASRVFNEICTAKQGKFILYSLHDKPDAETNPYMEEKLFRGFGGRRFIFVLYAVIAGLRSKCVVISHINLALPAYIIKMVSPKTKVVVMAHGIEVWQSLSGVRKKLLAGADLVVSVSSFTRDKIHQGFTIRRSAVINNCIDPFLPPDPAVGRNSMRCRLGLSERDFVLLTVSRLKSTEGGKNFDKILKGISDILPQAQNLQYVMVGKYEADEKERLETLAEKLGLKNRVHIAGYIPDSDLPSWYSSADLYIMPSKKEGFGITFVEAMYYGLPVIGGSRDGSADALLNGKLGILIDPDRQDEITAAISKVYYDTGHYKPDRNLVIEHFGFEVYKKKWEEILGRDDRRASRIKQDGKNVF